MKENVEDIVFFDIPHEEYMDIHGINFNDLPDMIKEAIIVFDKFFVDAESDKFIDDKEEIQIFNESMKIVAQLEAEYSKNENSNNDKKGGKGILGFVLGATLGVLGGAMFTHNVNK